jgi:hypothetical protein
LKDIMNAVVAFQPPQGALAHSQASGRMAVADIISHVAMVQEVMRAVMKPEVHYGIIPGTDKPTLYKQGAEVLCMAFRVADSYQVEDLSTAEVVRYRVTCTGVHQMSGLVLGTGMGEASSGEEKYKWRKAWDEEWNATPANLRRIKSGKYTTKQVRTEPADLANTILKMANKRAKIAMTINVTACGDMFGQDLEDMDEALRDHLTRHNPEAAAAAAGATAKPTLPTQTEEEFAKNMVIWTKVIKTKKKDVAGVLATVATVSTLTEAQIEAIKGIPAKLAAEAQAEPSGPTWAQVAEALATAKDEDALNVAADLIGAISDEKAREQLNARYDARRAELNAE